MKYLLIILLCIISSTVYGQQDSVTVAKSSIIRAATTIRSQRDSINELNLIIAAMTNNNNIQSVLLGQSKVETELLTTRVGITDGIIDRYQEHLKGDKRKWFDLPLVNFGAGLLTAYVSSIIYRNIK